MADEFAITEGVSGLYHYHLSRPEARHIALCGIPTMPTGMAMPRDWQKPFGEHFLKRPTWCTTCGEGSMTAPLIPDAEKAAFEAWAVLEQPDMSLHRAWGGYAYAPAAAAWASWKAARRELLARQVAEWMPISTAPKDGTQFWLADHFSMRVGFWSIDCWADFEVGRQLRFTPTHWQNLPTAPPPDNSAFSKPDQAPSEDGKSAGSKPAQP